MLTFDPRNFKGLFLILLVSGVVNKWNVVSISIYDIKSEIYRFNICSFNIL